MSITTGATDMIGAGGAGYGFGGGFGGIAPVGLIGINNLFDRDRDRCGDRNGFDNSGITVMEQNVSELRKDVAGVNTTVEALGNELQGAIFNLNSGIQSEFRNLDNQICDVEKTLLQQGFALSTQGMQNTQAVKDQMTQFQISTDKQFCQIENAIHADGDQTRQLINSIEMQNLRDALEMERRGRSEREVEINITNSNTSLQNQFQQQQQLQRSDFANFANLVSDQLARQTNSLVNIGGTMTGTGQSNSSANTKVN